MSYVVKGYEFPQSCSECWLIYPEVGDSGSCIFTGVYWENEEDRPSKSRLSECPLVEIPTPHGRLIDADRLLALVEKEVNNTCIGCDPEPDDCCAYDRFKEIISKIKNARTVIEAEELNK